MWRKIGLPLTIVVGFLFSLKALADTCQSFAATSRVKYQDINGWTINAQKVFDRVTCHAEKNTSQSEIGIVYSPTNNSNENWRIVFVLRQRQLPESIDRAPGSISIKEKEISDAKVEFVKIGHTVGMKRVSEYVMAEVLTNNISPFEDDNPWIITSKTTPQIKINSKDLGKSAISALKRCMQQATDKKSSEKFWANSVHSCG